MSLPALALPSDVLDRLGRPFTAIESARVVALLADASAAVRLYTGQQFTEATTTAVFKMRRGVVRLPQRPVTAVASAVDINAQPVLYSFDGIDSVYVSVLALGSFAFEPWLVEPSTVTVEYTHGYPIAELPEALVGIVCQIVMRALGQAPDQAGITSESIAGYSYTIGVASATQAFGLLPGEKDALDRFTRSVGMVEMQP